ncbi:MAG: thioredoxin domain-containing protein, partial [Acidobacteria bacterium]|nr:thioredoxin domain-containing protein [Acidobacteriota bacterium]
MKKLFFSVIFFLIVLSIFSQEFSEGSLDSIIQKAKNEDKIVMMKFYSDTCSWCKKLDKEVLIPENLDKLSRLVVLYKINSKTEEGKILRKKYNITGVPTIVLLSKEGNEIDRIVGYEKKDEFLKELLSYLFNIGTLSDLTAKIEKEPSFDLFYKIANKYYERGDNVKSLEFVRKAKNEKQLSDKQRNNLLLLEGEVLLNLEPQQGIAILSGILEKGDGTISEIAFDDLKKYYKTKEDYDNLINIFRKALKNKSNDVSFLNSFAWTMAEIEKNLEEGLAIAKKAVELSKEDPEILDTLAEIYFKMGDSDSAIRT